MKSIEELKVASLRLRNGLEGQGEFKALSEALTELEALREVEKEHREWEKRFNQLLDLADEDPRIHSKALQHLSDVRRTNEV